RFEHECCPEPSQRNWRMEGIEAHASSADLYCIIVLAGEDQSTHMPEITAIGVDGMGPAV
ncbi:hypothetical protein ABTK88_19670, partial [Acinetobacter baumannii]